MKKGQITIFITIGIVLFITFLIVFFVRSDLIKKGINIGEKVDPNLVPLKKQVDECLRLTSEDGANLLGAQGGHIFLRSGTYLDTEYSDISILYTANKPIKLDKIRLEQEFNDYMKDALLICLDDFKNLKNSGMDIKYGTPKFNTKINEKNVEVNLNFNVVLTKQGKAYKLNTFLYTLPIKLGFLIDAVNNILEGQVGKRSRASILSQYDINTTTFYYEDHLIYALDDNDYDFIFAVR